MDANALPFTAKKVGSISWIEFTTERSSPALTNYALLSGDTTHSIAPRRKSQSPNKLNRNKEKSPAKYVAGLPGDSEKKITVAAASELAAALLRASEQASVVLAP